MKVEYNPSKPTVTKYKQFFESTGWTSSITISDEVLQEAMDNSWFWVSAYSDETLIGIGRLVSDGALYAFVCDIIVLPPYRRQGVGSKILETLTAHCRRQGIQRVWLFAAQGQVPFYQENEFEARPDDSPGMQMVDN